MDLSVVQLAVAGVLVSLSISLVRRYTKWSSEATRWVAIVVCMLVVAGFQFIQSNPILLEYLQNLLTLYGAGQGLYQLILRPTQADKVIEGEITVKEMLKK